MARHSQAVLDTFAGMITEPHAPDSDLGDVIAADTDIPQAEPARDVFFAERSIGQRIAGDLPRPAPGARWSLPGWFGAAFRSGTKPGTPWSRPAAPSAGCGTPEPTVRTS